MPRLTSITVFMGWRSGSVGLRQENFTLAEQRQTVADYLTAQGISADVGCALYGERYPPRLMQRLKARQQ